MFSDGASFFVRWLDGYSGNSYCINDTGVIQSKGSWGSLSFLEFSHGSCLNPSAQFRFRDNGAMLNLKRQGCLAGGSLSGSGYNVELFYLYVDSVSLDRAACAQKPNEGIYRAINQTSLGALSVYYKGQARSSFETWCASFEYNYQIRKEYGIGDYTMLITSCGISQSQKFIFGKFQADILVISDENCHCYMF